MKSAKRNRPMSIISRKNFFALLFIAFSAVSLPSLLAEKQNRYISTEQIKPGDSAYCLSVFKGTKIEKFPLQVVDVVKNIQPGRDGIVVRGTGPVFEKYGPIQGCSGSPVYINGKLAGALAGGWRFTDEPLYIVTTIEQMLEVGEEKPSKKASAKARTIDIDYSNPINLEAVMQKYKKLLAESFQVNANNLPIITNLNQNACTGIQNFLSAPAVNLMPNAGGSYLSMQKKTLDTPIEPGSVITIPLSKGDITFTVLGTATEVVGDKVYAFGHPFMGKGPVQLPMANGYVYTVVDNIIASFKFGSAGKIMGTFTADQGPAAFGTLGKMPPMIDFNLTVDHFADTKIRTYQNQIAVDPVMSPMIVIASIMGTVEKVSFPPPEHTLEYSATINIKGYDPIHVENVSSQREFADLFGDTAMAIVMLQTNPFKELTLESLDLRFALKPNSIAAGIQTVNISDTVVKPGQNIDISVITKKYRSEKQKHNLTFRIPHDIPPGQYNLTITGQQGYQNFLNAHAPAKFTAYSAETLVKAIRNMLKIKRNRLYVTLTTAGQGISLRNLEMPNLPGTKSILFNDPKRTSLTLPLKSWTERSIKTGTFIMNAKTMKITVKKDF